MADLGLSSPVYRDNKNVIGCACLYLAQYAHRCRSEMSIHIYAARPATRDFFKASTNKAVKVYIASCHVSIKRMPNTTRTMNAYSKGGVDSKLAMYFPSLAACFFSCAADQRFERHPLG